MEKMSLGSVQLAHYAYSAKRFVVVEPLLTQSQQNASSNVG